LEEFIVAYTNFLEKYFSLTLCCWLTFYMHTMCILLVRFDLLLFLFLIFSNFQLCQNWEIWYSYSNVTKDIVLLKFDVLSLSEKFLFLKKLCPLGFGHYSHNKTAWREYSTIVLIEFLLESTSLFNIVF
jgi:hypothetical protein